MGRKRIRVVLALAISGLALGVASGCTKKDASSSDTAARVNTKAGSAPPREPAPSVKIWKELSLVEATTREIPASVKELIGKKQKVAGFAIINEMEAPDQLAEFLLTPISGGCVHVPPPPPNYIVRVVMKGGKKAKMIPGPMEVEGVLKLAPKAKDREQYSFEMEAESAERFQPNAR